MVLVLAWCGSGLALEPASGSKATNLPELKRLHLDKEVALKRFAKPRFSLMQPAPKAPERNLLDPDGALLLGSMGGITGFCLRSETPTGPYLAAGIADSASPEIVAGPGTAQPETAGMDLAYQVGMGLACNLGDGTRLDFGYRFLPEALLERGIFLEESPGNARDDHSISIDLKVPF
ncbi:hypothetical protein DESUT3_35940 [Desulfuromonas versatilis]|uniref:Uncharacterized protein n=1 Tax=Desulfuromonas versatilis TaxID=2802975 RepID=A0ABN6E2G7_9BACT|nr:hypothetical protein [Desulfuromonas versatilis]BCR06525.1 hypothetical protein DESUT3_35940 [Desulfuromonas versatilis]